MMSAMTTSDHAMPLADETSPRYRGWRVVLACYRGCRVLLGIRPVRSRRLSRRTASPARLADLRSSPAPPPRSICHRRPGGVRQRCDRAPRTAASDADRRPAASRRGGAARRHHRALATLSRVYLLMAVGAASMHVGAITNVVGLWFDRQRGLALSLALNGASSGGILVTPVLVLAIAQYGFATAMRGLGHGDGGVFCCRSILHVDRPAAIAARPPRRRPPPAAAKWTRRSALRSGSSGAWPRRSPWR